MNIAAYFIQRRVTSWLVALLLGIGGVIAFIDLGRLEDPAFTLKMAMVVTITTPRWHCSRRGELARSHKSCNHPPSL